jgi:hypothetical protein
VPSDVVDLRSDTVDVDDVDGVGVDRAVRALRSAP